MSAQIWMNRLLVAASFAGLLGGALLFKSDAPAVSRSNAVSHERSISIEESSDGLPSIRDARGRLVPIRDYSRIVAASLVSAEIVDAIVERERIAAFLSYAQLLPESGFQYRDKPGVESVGDVESILLMNPDIVFFNAHVDEATIARLEERRIAVFDLGPMVGVESYLQNTVTIATLLGLEERLERFVDGFERRLSRVRCNEQRPPAQAIVVTSVSGAYFGGTRGTSYADVMKYAGVEDAAAADFSGWPQYSPEMLLAMQPEWILTTENGVSSICSTATLRHLSACSKNQVVEIPSGYLNSVGSGILRAAELVHDAVYGPCGR